MEADETKLPKVSTSRRQCSLGIIINDHPNGSTTKLFMAAIQLRFLPTLICMEKILESECA